MDFLDTLTKVATDTAMKTIQKTQELSETARLNGQILEAEMKLKDVYAKIGKKYVALQKEEVEPEMEELLKVVRTGETKIAEYRRKLADVKGLTKCEYCGADIGKDAAFCSACGKPVEKPKEEQAEEEPVEEAEIVEEVSEDIFAEEEPKEKLDAEVSEEE